MTPCKCSQNYLESCTLVHNKTDLTDSLKFAEIHWDSYRFKRFKHIYTEFFITIHTDSHRVMHILTNSHIFVKIHSDSHRFRFVHVHKNKHRFTLESCYIGTDSHKFVEMNTDPYRLTDGYIFTQINKDTVVRVCTDCPLIVHGLLLKHFLYVFVEFLSSYCK